MWTLKPARIEPPMGTHWSRTQDGLEGGPSFLPRGLHAFLIARLVRMVTLYLIGEGHRRGQVANSIGFPAPPFSCLWY